MTYTDHFDLWEKMNCDTCKHADWQTTKAGGLHPSGDGRCTRDFTLPTISKAYYWISSPSIGGGHISRKHPQRTNGCQM